MTDASSDGYLTYLKTMNVEALKATLDQTYPIEQWRGIHISIEYPMEKMEYPGVWIDYSDMDKLKIAGIDHKESALDGQRFTRWKFKGYVSYTVTALTSLERDRLFDELVKIFAFGRFDSIRARFRQAIETNPYIAANMDFDQIEPTGVNAAPGTPWGTDEIIYERTINMSIVGEFISDNTTSTIVPLSAVLLDGHILLPGEEPEEVITGEGTTDWH